MHDTIRTRWTAALRSGEYKQTQSVLCQADAEGDPGSYCCLGVLCDLAVRDGVTPPPVPSGPYSVAFEFDGDHVTLPHRVRNWAGLDSADPFIPSDINADGVEREGDHLSAINDAGGDFAEIADLIDEYGDRL